MPLTSYCKKCGRDVPVADRCPHCSAKLPANTVRLAWCVDHVPVRDWMCWNAVLRFVLPAMGAVILLTLLLETLFGGLEALEMALSGSVVVSLLALLALLLAVLLLVLMLQGDDLLDCVMDSKGIHVQLYLADPTPLKLLLRGKDPRLMDALGEEPMLLLSSEEILWKDIQRVQLWPEKTMILFYAPRWWMRLSLPCTPFTWLEALELIREKIGRKKTVILPPECVQTAPPKAKSARPKKTRQLTFDDVPPQPIPEEEVPPELPDWTAEAAEKPEDFTSLADVLAEIKADEEAKM